MKASWLGLLHFFVMQFLKKSINQLFFVPQKNQPTMTKAVIVSYARTAIGKFRGGLLFHLAAPQLGAAAISGVLSSLGNTPEAYMGNVLSAGGVGQAPCWQAVLGAGLPESTICNTINKACASGMKKSIMLAAQTIKSNIRRHCVST
jgi:acetyl-CoA C-acetyltransferase